MNGTRHSQGQTTNQHVRHDGARDGDQDLYRVERSKHVQLVGGVEDDAMTKTLAS